MYQNKIFGAIDFVPAPIDGTLPFVPAPSVGAYPQLMIILIRAPLLLFLSFTLPPSTLTVPLLLCPHPSVHLHAGNCLEPPPLLHRPVASTAAPPSRHHCRCLLSCPPPPLAVAIAISCLCISDREESGLLKE
ncbi:hypothetical protein M9H77_22748 [Catharanthus roseus]|uniref:Uncharacterized protein n=1 Tax=Catharanthus roseus TaxID=4058 RepID=A0ACC0AT24_CATRO|nr:hypothetical protein M9H77_22748 [Catharanthus roseus]